jgi:predicted nucleic acid-binding Zn ribbon protein
VQRFLGALRPDAMRTLRANWPMLVGARLATACQLHSVRDGCLVVHTGEPAVAEHLRWLSADLVAAANAVLGTEDVREVRVSLVPDVEAD